MEHLHLRILEMLGKSPENINLIEEQIDLSEQIEFFELVANLKPSIDKEQILLVRNSLFETSFSIDEKKRLLVMLSEIPEVDAYRTIERFVDNCEPELRNWAIIARHKNRVQLESSMLDEKCVFLTTGLGGKGTKLRYFTVLLPRMDMPLTEIQKKIVKNEFEFAFQKSDCELEEIRFNDLFVALLVLIPLKTSISKIFNEVIIECNNLGNFLNERFIVTNVKALTDDEIEDFVRKTQNK